MIASVVCELKNAFECASGWRVENAVVAVDISLVTVNIASLTLWSLFQSLSCFLLLVVVMPVLQVLACE